MHCCAPSAYMLAYLTILTIMYLNSTSILSLYIIDLYSLLLLILLL
jgi:hypothetical protein